MRAYSCALQLWLCKSGLLLLRVFLWLCENSAAVQVSHDNGLVSIHLSLLTAAGLSGVLLPVSMRTLTQDSARRERRCRARCECLLQDGHGPLRPLGVLLSQLPTQCLPWGSQQLCAVQVSAGLAWFSWANPHLHPHAFYWWLLILIIWGKNRFSYWNPNELNIQNEDRCEVYITGFR